MQNLDIKVCAAVLTENSDGKLLFIKNMTEFIHFIVFMLF